MSAATANNVFLVKVSHSEKEWVQWANKSGYNIKINPTTEEWSKGSQGQRYQVLIDQDCDPMNPREDFHHLSTMVCLHRRYKLGDTGHGYRVRDFDGWEDLEKKIIKDHPNCVILPMYMYDHSGITINTTGFS